MIEFEKIKFKNIGSYGNSFTEVSLNSHKMNLIVGSNGNGKSTLISAICFALYNKPYTKINKTQLLNSINKSSLVVEIEFKTNNKSYKVIRGIKPNIFEIYEDDILINQDAKTKDYQEYLENNILQITFKSFIQVVILGSARFSSFMDLSAADRRTIIEDLLDIQIFSSMNIVTKERLSELKSNIQNIKREIESTKEKLEIQKQNIQDKEKYSEDKIKHFLEEISKYEQQNIILNNEVDKDIKLSDELNNKILDHPKILSKRNKLIELKSKLDTNLSRIEKDQDFFDNNGTCPTCRQKIDLDHKQGIILDANEKKYKILDGLEKLKTEFEVTKNALNEINIISDEMSVLSRNILKNRTEITNNKSYITKLNSEISSLKVEESSIDKSKIKQLIDNLKRYNQEYEDLIEDKKHYDYVQLLLKDGGIKTQIIKQYLPILNKYINLYLEKMDFFVNFNINENFEEIIKSRHRDEFSINNFSEGEKLRINFALLLAFKQIAKIKNSVHTNLQIFDEILDSSADEDSVKSFIELMGEMDSNVFVISHRTSNIIDKFDRVIKVEKIKNFSKMKEI